MSCKHTLYGGWTVSGVTPESKSLLGVCLEIDEFKAAAEKVESKMENALTAVNNMKRPFVLYYSDQSAKDAMSALGELDDALSALDELIASYE